MKDKIERVILSCKEAYQVTVASRYLLLAYDGYYINDEECNELELLIESTYKQIEYYSDNQCYNA